jgi:hypothetical protein
MSILKYIFGRKTNLQPHKFSEVMQKKEHCIAFLPNDVYQDFEIISYLSNWTDIFENIIIFSSEYNHSLFSKFQNAGNISFRVFESGQSIFNESVILNFSDSREVQRFLSRCNNSTIADINNLANMQFVPEPGNAIDLLTKFSQFFDLPFQKSELSIELTLPEIDIVKKRFIQNRFHDFVFDCDNRLSSKLMEKYVKAFKQNFSANVYLTDKSFTSKEMINLEDNSVHNLYELFCLAAVSDLFITNKAELASLFGNLGYFVLLLGSETGEKNVRSVPVKEIFTLKNIIRQHLTEQDKLKKDL